MLIMMMMMMMMKQLPSVEDASSYSMKVHYNRKLGIRMSKNVRTLRRPAHAFRS